MTTSVFFPYNIEVSNAMVSAVRKVFGVKTKDIEKMFERVRKMSEDWDIMTAEDLTKNLAFKYKGVWYDFFNDGSYKAKKY